MTEDRQIRREDRQSVASRPSSCLAILLTGIVVGIIIGVFAGMTYVSWHYAEIISKDYIEILRTEDGGMFVSKNGVLYKLEEIKKVD